MTNDNIDLDEIRDRMIDPHKYEYVERLGAGKFGEVYKVKDNNDNYFALKQINVFDELKFNREVYILSLLDHPCVLNLEGFSKPQEGQPATIVTQLLSSKDLKDIVLENPPDWNATKKMINIYGIALGMDYCHSKYVLHRDLKPENILLNSRYEPHIADFGLSKVTDVFSMLIQSNITGTPSFTAPEMLDDDSCNEKMDVYSYAIIVYFIFTGQTPYQEETNYNTFKNMITNGLDNFKLPDEIPDLYQNLISTCWAKDPEVRPSFEDIVAALSVKENYLEGINIAEFEEYKRRVDNGIRLKEGEEPTIEPQTNEETQEAESNEETQNLESNEETQNLESNEETQNLESNEETQNLESNEETQEPESNEETKDTEAAAEAGQTTEENDENDERNTPNEFESSSSSTTSTSSESTDDENERNNEEAEENEGEAENDEKDNFDDSETTSTSSNYSEYEAENEKAEENKETEEKQQNETSELSQNEEIIETKEEELAADSQDTKDDNESNSPSFVIDQQNIEIGGAVRERSFNLIPMNEDQETSGETTKLEEPDKNAPNPLWVILPVSEIAEKSIESEFGQMQQEVGENGQSKEAENPWVVVDSEEASQLNLQQDEHQNKEETNEQEEFVDPSPWVLQPGDYENKEENLEQKETEITEQEEFVDPSPWVLQPEDHENKEETTEETQENQAEEKQEENPINTISNELQEEHQNKEEFVDPSPWVLQPEEYENKEETTEETQENQTEEKQEIESLEDNQEQEFVDPSPWVLQPEEYENKEENSEQKETTEDSTTSVPWVVQPEDKVSIQSNEHQQLQPQDDYDYIAPLNVVTKSISPELTQIVDDCIATQNARELISRLNSQACDTETKSALYEKIRVDSPSFYTSLINEGLNQDDSFTHHKRGLNLIAESSQSTDRVERMAKLREAEKEFKKSIQSGQSYSYLPLSLVYYTMPNKEVSAFNAASEGAKRGDKKCGCLRGFFIAHGIGTKRCFDKGVLIILDNKVESLHDQFATDIAIHKARKCNPDEPSQSSQKVEAFKWFERAFNLRKTRATINNYGLCFLTGFGCQKDTEKAMEVFRIGVQNNDADSMYHAGFILEEDNPIESLRLYKEAADNSNVDAQNYYAYLKSKTDKNESLKYLDMAASQNDQLSMTSLAKLLTSTEKEKSLILLKKAAFAGNVEAQEILARKYSNENDIENAHLYLNMLLKSGNCEVPTEYALNLYKMKKFKNAFYWFRRMAEENNNPIAIYFLGVMTFHGHGCEKNRDEAYRIMSDLSKKGVGKASDFIDNYFEEEATLSSM